MAKIVRPETVVKIGVVGTRKRKDDVARQQVFDAITKVIDQIYEAQGGPEKVLIQLVSGGCKEYLRKEKKWVGCGADWFAEEYAAIYGFSITIHYPRHHTKDPDKHGKWEAFRVNYERNTYIADDSHWLIACVTPERKGGTEDTVKKFEDRCGGAMTVLV